MSRLTSKVGLYETIASLDLYWCVLANIELVDAVLEGVTQESQIRYLLLEVVLATLSAFLHQLTFHKPNNYLQQEYQL